MAHGGPFFGLGFVSGVGVQEGYEMLGFVDGLEKVPLPFPQTPGEYVEEG